MVYSFLAGCIAVVELAVNLAVVLVLAVYSPLFVVVATIARETGTVIQAKYPKSQ